MNHLIFLQSIMNLRGVGRKKSYAIVNQLQLDKSVNVSENEFIEQFSSIKEFKLYKIEINELRQCIDAAKRIFEEHAKNNISSVAFFENDFPKKLLEIKDPPVLLFYKGNMMAFTVFGGIAGAFFFPALVRPNLLVGVYLLWMKFADVVGRFNTRVILSLTYMVVFTLSRLLLFVLRKDPLQKKINTSLDSYWSDHEPVASDPKRYEKQF